MTETPEQCAKRIVETCSGKHLPLAIAAALREREKVWLADLRRIGPCCNHEARCHRPGDSGDGTIHLCDVCEAEKAVARECAKLADRLKFSRAYTVAAAIRKKWGL